MKTFKAGNIEVMSHDYYTKEGNKGHMHMNWKDYEFMQFDPFLRELRAEGWRVPTEKEARYLLELHKIWIGGFSDKWPPYSTYFIEPYIRENISGKKDIKPKALNFHNGRVEEDLSMSRLCLLRLVRSL